jgi:hypothetical protein
MEARRNNLVIDSPVRMLGDFSKEILKWLGTICASSCSRVELFEHDKLSVARKKSQAVLEDKKAAAKLLDELKLYQSPYLIKIYKARLRDTDSKVLIWMEFMDCLSLDDILNKVNRKPIEMIGRHVVPVR